MACHPTSLLVADGPVEQGVHVLVNTKFCWPMGGHAALPARGDRTLENEISYDLVLIGHNVLRHKHKWINTNEKWVPFFHKSVKQCKSLRFWEVKPANRQQANRQTFSVSESGLSLKKLLGAFSQHLRLLHCLYQSNNINLQLFLSFVLFFFAIHTNKNQVEIQ